VSEKYIKYSDEYFPYDEMSTKHLFTALMQLPYFKCVVHKGKIVGWFAAKEASPFSHSLVKCLSQVFYHTTLTKWDAANMLIEIHRDFFKYATYHKYHIVCSSSFLPNKNSFYGILETDGWKLLPVGAVKRTEWHPSMQMGQSRDAERSRLGVQATPDQRRALSLARQLDTLFGPVEDQLELPLFQSRAC
jgi:hypothetical protein